MQKEKEKKIWGIDDELIFTCAYRYCIGRHSYIKSLVDKFAKDGKEHLTDERLRFVASDIRNEIASQLGFQSYHFRYDGTVAQMDRKPLEDFLDFVNTLENPEEELCSIESIEVYHESYNPGEPHKYRVSKHGPDVRSYLSQMTIEDLLPWAALASYFDSRDYVKLTLNDNGKISEEIACVAYDHELEKVPGCDFTFKNIPWRFRKIYKSVDEFHGGYFDPEKIVKVEKIEK